MPATIVSVVMSNMKLQMENSIAIMSIQVNDMSLGRESTRSQSSWSGEVVPGS